MAYTKELQDKLDELGIRKENILYLTLENENIQDMRDGVKDTEYRNVTDFLLSRLFSINIEKKFQKMKPKTHVLFQGGYNPNSPRMLIELLGFSVGTQIFPKDKELKQTYRLYEALDLFLGKIVYDSLDFLDSNSELFAKPKNKSIAKIPKSRSKTKSKNDLYNYVAQVKNDNPITYNYFIESDNKE